MDDMTLVTILVGVTCALLIAGLVSLTARPENKQAEQRLDGMTSNRTRAKAEKAADSLLKAPPIQPGQLKLMQQWLPSSDGIRKLYEAADLDLDFGKFMTIVGLLTLLGGAMSWFMLSPLSAPLGALFLGYLPFLFLMSRKKRRIKLFLNAMPEAVELMGRALRAGHGLASGFQLVAHEMKGPLADEFSRVFEEQNLGIPMEVALRGMADRVPSMDVRFLVTAIVIQRATGGDLAEVLDKIGRLIRQRFELFGHVQALTAEGRLSGIVLLAMPPSLLAFLSISNYPYIAPLFTTPLGTKMLGITAFLQVLGAISIKKIVSIKV